MWGSQWSRNSLSQILKSEEWKYTTCLEPASRLNISRRGWLACLLIPTVLSGWILPKPSPPILAAANWTLQWTGSVWSCQKTNLVKTGEFFARLVSWIQSVRFPVSARTSIRQWLGLCSRKQQCGGERRRCKSFLIAICKFVSSASCLASPSGWIQWIPQASISNNPPFAQLLPSVPVLSLHLHQHKHQFSHLINYKI